RDGLKTLPTWRRCARRWAAPRQTLIRSAPASPERPSLNRRSNRLAAACAGRLPGKMVRPEEFRDSVEGIIVDENGAKERLFRLDVMRREAVCGLGAAREAGSLRQDFRLWA